MPEPRWSTTRPRTRQPSPGRTVRRAAASLLGVLLLAGACTSGDGGDLARAESAVRPDDQADTTADPDGELSWTGCLSEMARGAGLDCATLTVPVDRNDPDGDTLELELARRHAGGDPSERIGSILLNPGGPGGSGIEFLASAATAMPEVLTESFDLVSWDPRGVGESTPVWCLDDDRKDAQVEGDLSPDDDAETRRAVEDQEEMRTGCENDEEGLIEHMSTADVAGDVEEIRDALGEDQLNYIGFSYGTAIGATYATLFPDRVRAMVLDGAVSHPSDDIQVGMEQSAGIERTYLRFIAACDADPECPLSGRTADTVAAVRAQLDSEPQAVGDRELTRDLFDLGLATAMYGTTTWGPAARAIAEIDDGGAEVLLSLADRQLGRASDGSWDNSWDAQVMVSCADSEYRPTLEEALADGERLAASSPTFGEMFRTGSLSCLDWPLAHNPVPDWTAEGSPTVLVIGTLGDPATPYEWAEEMTQTLGNAYLLTYEGEGHTAFLSGGECVVDPVVNYLVDGALPPPGRSCPAVEATDGAFDAASDILLDELTSQGLPADVAQCIVDGLEDELGEEALDELLTSNDAAQLGPVVTEITIECLGGG